jgi:probable rRNA maturation factor
LSDLAHSAPGFTPRQPPVTNGEYELSEARVDIQVDTRFQQAFAAASLDRLLLDVAETALIRELVSGPDHVTLIITDDEALRKLNLKFMGYDEPTDVLSFNTGVDNSGPSILASSEYDPSDGKEADSGDSEMLNWPDADGEESGELGDIAISYERAVAQAETAGHDVAHELSVLTAHGVLHLLGYDHAKPEEHRVMFGKTDDILAAVPDRSDRPDTVGNPIDDR